MSTIRPLPGYRLAQTRVGDTLQVIAARELGDAARWIDLVSVNNLAAPFITDDATLAGARVLLAGQRDIIIPAPAPAESGVAPGNDESLFGRDCALSGGLLTPDANGGIALVDGPPNLVQALNHAIETRPGEMVFHPDYGCRIAELLGARNDAIADQLGAYFVKQTLQADTRIASATVTAVVNGDALEIDAQANTTDGRRVAVRSA